MRRSFQAEFVYQVFALIITIIVIHAEHMPGAVATIVSGAFSPQGVAGGTIGVLFQGFQRAAFSNEAGVGSAAIAHSAVRTTEPVTEGYVSLLEPFIDTVVICTMTALVIIITGQLMSDPETGLYWYRTRYYDPLAGRFTSRDNDFWEA